MVPVRLLLDRFSPVSRLGLQPVVTPSQLPMAVRVLKFGVAVIGSACTTPGSVLVECEPVEGFRHDGEVEAALPVRFRVDGLWGMHLRADLLAAGGMCGGLPVAGMSCAVVEVPASTRVRVAGLGAVPAWSSDAYLDDTHYSIRFIRTTVSANDTG